MIRTFGIGGQGREGHTLRTIDVFPTLACPKSIDLHVVYEVGKYSDLDKGGLMRGDYKELVNFD
jgi:hypothetical protein